MNYLTIILLFTALFLVSATDAVELEDIERGDYYWLVNSSIKSNWKIVTVIEIDKDNDIIKVQNREQNYLWVSPDDLSYAENDFTNNAIGGFSLFDALTYATVDDAVKNMDKANIAFNMPMKMNVGDVRNIRLLLSYKDTLEQLESEIKKAESTFSETIQVSSRMEAKLIGNNFVVTSISPEIQAITKEQKTEWLWAVQPKKEGAHIIYLTLTAFISIKGEQTPRMIKTFEKKVVVEVTFTQKAKNIISSNWQWFWAAMLVPVGGWLWNRKKS